LSSQEKTATEAVVSLYAVTYHTSRAFVPTKAMEERRELILFKSILKGHSSTRIENLISAAS
jgi:hypothetical protein